MAETHEQFFNDLESQFTNGNMGKKPIPIADFSPIHGLLQYAHDLQGELRQFNVSDGHVSEMGTAAAYMLDKRLNSLIPQEMSLSFVAIKSFAILDQLEDGRFEMFDFEGIHIANGTPKEFIFGKIYDRPTLSLTFENSEFLSEVALAEENPSIPSDFLAVPVYSLRLDKD